jgi:membrane fusion protein (multidrug efflux system)
VFRPSSQQVLDWKSDPRSAPLLEPGGKLEVRVVLPNGALLPRTGRLTFVAPSLDSATGTQEFRATFENHDRILLPGQFVNVRLSGFSRANALAVPQRAIQTGLGRMFVYVVSAGDTVVARDVKTGPWSGTLWIVDDGLKPGDRVIVDGVQKVAPGRVVKPSPITEGKPTVVAPGANR